MRCNGSNWAVYSPGSWDGIRNDLWALWALWAGVIMRLEHHLVGGYVRYISPHIILLLYTVWTFFCSRVLKKVKFFKPLPFPLKIVLGRISSQSFLLIFSSILRQITTYIRENTGVEQCFKFLHCVDIFTLHLGIFTLNKIKKVQPIWKLMGFILLYYFQVIVRHIRKSMVDSGYGELH